MWRQLTIQRLMVAVLFILIFVMAIDVPTDTDTWWHLRSGRYIVEERTIPRTDPFSHTRYGEAWIDHSWASQVALYGAYELFGGGIEPGDGGNVGLAIYVALLATGGMAFVYLMGEGDVYVRAFATVLGAAAAAIFWAPRPHMMSFLLGAAVLYVIHLFRRKGIDRLWLIPMMMMVWANLHGGFAIGFIFLIATLVGETIGNVLDSHAPHRIGWRRLGYLGLITLMAFVVIALNPYGIQMLGYPFRTVSIGVLQDFIQEWASPDFHRPETWPFVALLLGTLSAAALSSRRIDWTDLVLVTGTAVMALTAARNIAVFAIAATPVLARHLDSWLADQGWRLRPRRRVTPAMAAANWALLALIGAGGLATIAITLDRSAVRDAQIAALPVELAASLRAEPPEGRLFNSYNWGGYLMFAAPDVPVFVDGRTDLYDDAFLRAFLRTILLREGWQARLDAYDVGVVAVEADSVLAAMLRTLPAAWREQRFDGGRSALFERVGGDG